MITLVLFVVAVCMVFLGLTVVMGSSENRITRLLFGFMALAIAVWAIGIALFVDDPFDVERQLLGADILYGASVVFPLVFFLLSLWLRGCSRTVFFIVTIGTLSTAAVLIFYLAAVEGGSIIASITPGDLASVQIRPRSYILFAGYLTFWFVAGVYMNFRRYLAAYGKKRRQTGLYTIGVLATCVPALYTNLWLPYFGDYSVVWAGPMAVLFFLLVTVYGIIKHGLFDIKFTAARTAAYVLSLTTMGLVYFSAAYVVSIVIFQQGTASPSVSIINIVLTLILAIAFQPIKYFFDKATDKFFYFGNYNTDDFIAELGDILTSTTDLKSLLMKVNAKIDQTFKSSWSSFAVLKRESGVIQVGSGRYMSVSNETVLRLYDVSGRASDMIQVASLIDSKIPSHQQFAQQLSKGGVLMILPLIRTDSHVGYLLIGARRAGRYSRRDIRVLETVSNELVIAIQNALSVQEVKDVNTNLQQRIDQATEKLRLTNERLQRLDETKDEFMSMASHQLRTPLTSIKGYLSMVLDGDVGPVTEQQKKFLTEAFTSSERMVRLISDFLNVSRLQTGKFTVERRPTDLAQIVRHEVETMQRLAEGHGVKLLLQIEKGIPKLLIDEDKLRQVIMNIIDNSIYYSPSGTSVIVKLYTKFHWVTLEVHDQGIGVPLQVQNQLFTKFFRADNARNQRPDGTGVGLFLAKKVITALEGEMVFESHPSKGSVFGFRLPLKKLKVPNWQ